MIFSKKHLLISIKQINANLISSRVFIFLIAIRSTGLVAQSINKEVMEIISKPLNEYTWDLSTLYNNEDEWKQEIVTIERAISSIDELQELVIDDSEDLLMILDAVSDLRSRAAKMVVYGALTSNLDKTSSEAEKGYVIALSLEDQVEAAISFMQYRIAEIPTSRLQVWLDKEPALKKHTKRINRILFEKDYFLDSKTESALNEINRFRLQSGQTYEALMDAEINWPVFRGVSDSIVINPATYAGIRRRDDAESRQAISVYHTFLSKYEDLLAIQLTKRIEKDYQLAKMRGFNSGIDAEFLFRDGFPEGTVEKFRRASINSSGLLSQFIQARANMSGSKASYANLYYSNKRINTQFPLDRSLDILFESTKRFGKAYQERLVEVLKDSTLHLANVDTKRRMWAVYPPVGGAKAYTIMSYDESILSSNVLSRAIIANLAQHHYTPDTRDDPPVYNNGVVYVGSLVHYEYLIEHSESKEEKLFYLGEATNQIWNSFFKYAIYASFEFEIEKKIANGQPLEGKDVSDIYFGVLKNFFGESMELPNHYRYEWMTIAQPFYSYEHQYWPVAMAVASNILDRVENDEAIQKLLLGQIKATSDRSYQILKEVGIDLNKEATYNSILIRMRGYLDEMNLLMK